MHPIQPETLALGFIWYAVFLFSTTCHEAAHALAAKLGGDPTAFHGVALAGPAANFLLVLAAAAAIRIGMALGHFRVPIAVSFTRITESTQAVSPTFATTLLSVFFVLNLLLGTFNLLPVPPLDGNTGVTLIMSKRAALKFLDWTQHSGFGLLGLVVAWVIFGRIFHSIFRLAFLALYPEAALR